MKKILILLSILVISICSSGQPAELQLAQLKQELTDNLTGNILTYWSSKMPDKVNGGFYGRIDVNDRVYPDEDKGGILNARILWTFSSAYRIMKDTSYLSLAKRSYDYIIDHFIDKQYGGAYRSVNAKGEPSDTRKQTYTQSFFIYALAEYYRATGEKEALRTAMGIYDCFEKYALDREEGGYFEVYTRNWERSHDKLISEKTDRDEKTMNTSLHLMEAYANLYRVSHDQRVGESLERMILIFINKIIDKSSFHLVNFFDRSWNSTSSVDSYGHDIESSWLLYEAATILGDKSILEKVRQVSIKIADAASEGIMPDGSMIDEKDHSTGEVRNSRSWWPQAETVVGYVNAWELTGNKKYLDYALNNWKYTNVHFVDHMNGGWFTSVNDAGVRGRGDKGGFWVCPYHNGRMCLEIIARSQIKEKIHP